MINIHQPQKFDAKLQEVIEAFGQLLELSKEAEYNNESEEEPYYGKVGFQISSQFNRPTEFLESLLDMIRVTYEPCTLGTLLLNSNPVFFYEAVPTTPFQLGYISLTKDAGQSFSDFWSNDVEKHIKKCGYKAEAVSTMFAAISTGSESYGLNFIDSVAKAISVGFSVDEATQLFASAICDSTDAPRKQTYAGFCLDHSLSTKTRLSLWLFMEHEKHIEH